MLSDNWETDAPERTQFVLDCFCFFSDESVFVMAAAQIFAAVKHGKHFRDNFWIV